MYVLPVHISKALLTRAGRPVAACKVVLILVLSRQVYDQWQRSCVTHGQNGWTDSSLTVAP